MKYLYESLENTDADVKQFRKTKKNMHNQIKTLKKQNNKFLKMSNNTSSCCELNKIKKIMKSSYKAFIRNDSSSV